MIDQQQLYEIIKNNLPVGLTLVDKDGIIQDFNSQAEAITGYQKTEVIGKLHFEILHSPPYREACPLFAFALQKKQQTVEVESTIKKKNGESITITATVSPLFDKDKNFIGGIELFRDISQLKKLERERKNILPMFAHDMKNPVTTSAGFLSRLLSGKAGPLTEIQASYLQIIKDGLKKLEELIIDFLEFSRFEAKEYIPLKSACNLEDTLASQIETVRLEADKKDIRIFFEYPDIPIPVIDADCRMINRIISNLLDNALKYSNPGAMITFRLTEREKDVLVQIIDTGKGIPEEQLPYIFDAFHRFNRDTSGSGLGLSIAKTIVEAHGGKIWAESTHGKGSTFSFLLPK
ncbi:MAG: PAS domain-containing sensor histidine kinase [Nitrospirae bacterium]|nr:PAS domain-containing sensor histidine kinase [Nitrospirota bacterium]